MALALVSFVATALAYPWHLPLAIVSFYHPRLTAFVHLNTLGTIGAMILGASLQLTPVMTGTYLRGHGAARLAWWLYVGGSVGLIAGLWTGWHTVLAIGGALLYGAIHLYALAIVLTARGARRDVTLAHILAALAALIAAANLGAALAIAKGAGWLGEATIPTLATHAALMLGGWALVTLAGFAPRLALMFVGGSAILDRRLAWLDLALLGGGSWLLAGAALTRWHIGALIGSIAIGAGLLCLGVQMSRVYRVGRRPADPHVPFAAIGLITGFAAIVALGIAASREAAASDPLWVAAGWLAIVGCLQTTIQGFLHKIVPFLAWLHHHIPRATVGHPPPLPDALISPTLRGSEFVLWTCGVALGAIGILAASPLALDIASASLGFGLIILALSLLRVAWPIAPRILRGR